MGARLIVAGIAIACAIGVGIWLLAGDNEDSDSGGSETTETAAPTETADPLPELPRGWSRTVNQPGGYAIGVPPGWSARRSAAKTTLRSPGSAVVVSVTADRSNEALEAPLDSYASGTAAGLEEVGEATPLARVPKPAPGYESAGVEAKGSGGRIEVIVVRRPELAAYPVLIASGIGVKPAELEPIVSRLVGSLRGRPVALSG